MMGSFHSSLDFVKSGDVNALYVVLKGLDLLRQFLDGNLIVLNNAVNNEFVDPVTDGLENSLTPQETVHLDGAHQILHFLHIGFVVPRLHV